MVIEQDFLAQIRAKHRGEIIVLTSGTYDLFHVGHLNYLNEVKKHGDVLVVMMSGDARVRARKGSKRPIISEPDRAAVLDALKVVDYVFVDPGLPEGEQQIYREIVDKLQPDIYVTDGEDIRFSNVLNDDKYLVLGRTDSGNHASTTAIIEHILETQ